MTSSTAAERGARRITPARALRAVFLSTLCLWGGLSCADEGAKPAGSAARSGQLPALERGAAKGFNVLLVTLDTVRADALGCYGDPKAKTPNSDRLAQRGVRFTRALAPTPITLPSHSTLMTGLDPLSHGVRNNGTFKLDAAHETFAERLKAAGYDTAAVVSSFVLDARYGIAQGFASYDDDVHVDGTSSGPQFFRERKADRVTQRAIEWLEDRPGAGAGAPFFLWTHYFDAHAPYEAPAKHLPPGVTNDPNAPYDADVQRARYLAEVSYADEQLGLLLARIDAKELKRTLIVLTADHGEGLGDHGEFTHSRLIYDATMRVPLILSCPALFASPTVVSDRVVGLVDVAPTLLSLLGLAPFERADGRSLFESAPDAKRTIYGESMVTQYNHGWAPLHSLSRVGDKAIRAPRPEYYDVASDPKERQNLVAVRRSIADPLLADLESRLRGAEAAAPEQLRLDPETERALAALGYSRSTPTADGGVALDPKDAITTWAILTNAQTYNARGEHARALAEIEQVLALNPADPFAWESLYVTHLARGSLEEAQNAILKVVELHPSSEGFVRLAWLLLQRDQLAQCEAAARRAEELEPEHGEVSLIRGELEVRRKRYDAAIAQFERARAIDPTRTAEKARAGIEAVRKLRGD